MNPAPADAPVTESRGDQGQRIISAQGWLLVVPKGSVTSEPEIADTALADRLGLPIHKLRQLSSRHEEAGNISPRVIYTTVVETSGRPGKARFYTEADALFLVTRSSATKAVALTREMIAVYMAVRRHLLGAPPQRQASWLDLTRSAAPQTSTPALTAAQRFTVPGSPPRPRTWETSWAPLPGLLVDLRTLACDASRVTAQKLALAQVHLADAATGTRGDKDADGHLVVCAGIALKVTARALSESARSILEADDVPALIRGLDGHSLAAASVCTRLAALMTEASRAA